MFSSVFDAIVLIKSLDLCWNRVDPRVGTEPCQAHPIDLVH